MVVYEDIIFSCDFGQKIVTELRKKIILSQKTIIKLFTNLSEVSVLLAGYMNQ